MCQSVSLPSLCFCKFFHTSLLGGASLIFYYLLISQLYNFHLLHNFNYTVSSPLCPFWNAETRMAYHAEDAGSSKSCVAKLSVSCSQVDFMMMLGSTISFNFKFFFLATSTCQENYFRQMSVQNMLLKCYFQVQYWKNMWHTLES